MKSEKRLLSSVLDETQCKPLGARSNLRASPYRGPKSTNIFACQYFHALVTLAICGQHLISGATWCPVLNGNQTPGQAQSLVDRRACRRPRVLDPTRVKESTPKRSWSVWSSVRPSLLQSQRRALLSLSLWGGGRSPAGTAAGARRVLPAARADTHAVSPAEPSRAGAHASAHTHTRTDTPAHPGRPPSPPPGRGPARRHLRLRHPACVYNFVLLRRPPCSWKGGGGMWKVAARRLTGGSSGGLRRPKRLSFAEVARPLFAVPRARAGLCVLPPRP